MPNMTLLITILSFSNIARDARVLRQIEYLSPHFNVSVIGYGDGLSAGLSNIPFHSVGQTTGIPLKILRWTCLIFGKLLTHKAYEYLYWKTPEHRQALAALLKIRPGIIHANDLEALPVAVRAAETISAKIVLDLHEYAPLEEDHRFSWHVFYKPFVEYLLKRYSLKATETLTVCEAISEKYMEEFGFRPTTIMNASALNNTIGYRPTDSNHIRLVHHGGALRQRRLERMIQTLALADKRFELHFMLLGETSYQDWLQAEADRIVPGRVYFHRAVSPSEIVSTLNKFDMGFYLLAAENYNNSVALPNKFFDFIQAGLGVCIGPSPEMARLVRKYNFGVVTDSFEPPVVARQLNLLTADDIDKYKLAALEARLSLNANIEMQKLLNVYGEMATT